MLSSRVESSRTHANEAIVNCVRKSPSSALGEEQAIRQRNSPRGRGHLWRSATSPVTHVAGLGLTLVWVVILWFCGQDRRLAWPKPQTQAFLAAAGRKACPRVRQRTTAGRVLRPPYSQTQALNTGRTCGGACGQTMAAHGVITSWRDAQFIFSVVFGRFLRFCGSVPLTESPHLPYKQGKGGHGLGVPSRCDESPWVVTQRVPPGCFRDDV